MEVGTEIAFFLVPVRQRKDGNLSKKQVEKREKRLFRLPCQAEFNQ